MQRRALIVGGLLLASAMSAAGCSGSEVGVVDGDFSAEQSEDGGEGSPGVDDGSVVVDDDPDASAGDDAGAAAPVVSVTDSILWGNAGFDVFVAGATLEVAGSLTEQPVAGDGNRTGDPGFVDAAGGDFALVGGSRAAGLGHTADLPS